MSISSTNQVVISNKVAVCISQPVAFNAHSSNRPQKQGAPKADQSAFGSGALVIISWFIDGAIDVLVALLKFLTHVETYVHKRI